MESLLQRLLDPNEVKQATRQLLESWQRPEALRALCEVLATSAGADVRKMAALLLRKRLGVAAAWAALDEAEQQRVRSGVLHALTQERDCGVQVGIAALIGAVASHTVGPKGHEGWPELFEFVGNAVVSQPPSRILGLYLVSALCDTCPGTLIWDMESLSTPLIAVLDHGIPAEGAYVVQAITHLVNHVGSSQLNVFRRYIQPIMNYIKRTISAGEENHATEAMELFNELAECEVPIVVPYIKPIVELSLQIAAQSDLDDDLRNKAIYYMGRFTRLKKKTCLKLKLYVPIIATLMPIICSLDEEIDMGNGTPHATACATLDTLALCLPPKKYMTALMTHIAPGLSSTCTDPSLLKGTYTSLGVSAEGCAEYIRKNHLAQFLQRIIADTNHEHEAVRSAALYALGQFSEHIQPDVGKHRDVIFPVLFSYLDKTIDSFRDNQEIDANCIERVFYAFEAFMEGLEEELMSFIPEILQRLVVFLQEDFEYRLKEFSMSAIGSIIEAVGGEIVPYVDAILSHVKKYLAYSTNSETQLLMMQSMDTLATLVRTLGRGGVSAELITDCCQLGVNIVTNEDDPDMKKCAFALFGAIAFAVGEEIAVVLPQITTVMLDSIRSDKGLSFEYKDDYNLDLKIEGAHDDVNLDLRAHTEPSSLDNVKTAHVEGPYLEEREQAVLALKSLCQNACQEFSPYLPEALEQGQRALHMPDPGLKQAALEALAEFTLAYLKLHNIEQLKTTLQILLPQFFELYKTEEDIQVVSRTLDTLTRLLKNCGGYMTDIEKCPEEVMACFHSVMEFKCACQDPEIEPEEEDQAAEEDEMLFECAGEVLPALGSAMSPHRFAPYLAGILQLLVIKTRSSLEFQRAFSVGVLAECLKPLAEPDVIEPFAKHLFPAFMAKLGDADANVRNNAVYGLGELALRGGEKVFPSYPDILQAYLGLLAQESEPRVIDQIIGGVSRMIIANHFIVPLPEVLPVVFHHLPLKEDFEEYCVVFRCLLLLLTLGNDLLKENADKVLHLCAYVYNTKAGRENEQTEPLLVDIVKSLCQAIPAAESMVARLPVAMAEKIRAILAL